MSASAARRLRTIAALLAVYLVVTALVDEGGGRAAGPRSSSFATSSGGLAALADLVERSGRHVRRLREPLAQRAPDRRSTLFVIADEPLPDREVKAIGRFVRGGGYAVVAGAPAEQVGALLTRCSMTGRGPATARCPTLTIRRAERNRALRPAAPAPQTAAVRVVRADGEAVFARAGATLPIMAGAGGPSVVAIRDARGAAVLLADPSPLRNRRLAAADNAAFALGLAAGRDVVFAENHHGYGPARGLRALPARWKVALVLLGAAAFVLMLARGRRFGPPERAGRDLPPARREYVDALAATLARTGDAAVLFEDKTKGSA